MKQLNAKYSVRGNRRLSGERVANAASHVDVLVMSYNLLVSGWGMERNPSQMKNRMNTHSGQSSGSMAGDSLQPVSEHGQLGSFGKVT